MRYRPIPDECALLIEDSILAIADTHIGIEAEFRVKGINVPSQTEKMLRRIKKICKDYNIKRLIHLGDVKHNIPRSKPQEWYEIPYFFNALLKCVNRIDLYKGNHDGKIENFVYGEKITVHSGRGNIITMNENSIGFFHGHCWPAKNIATADIIVMAHAHPSVIFSDRLGVRKYESCWLKARFNYRIAKKRYKNLNKAANVIILPAFNAFCTGTGINVKDAKLLGPLLTNKLIDIWNAEIYLPNGTYLGMLKNISMDIGL